MSTSQWRGLCEHNPGDGEKTLSVAEPCGEVKNRLGEVALPWLHEF